jgi:glycosyltransferase involved in cell wall biosynthesis
MRVLYHHRTQGTGVEAVHIMGIVSALKGLGHRVKIVGPPGTHPEISHAACADNHQGALTATWRFISDHAPEVLFEILEIGYNLFSFLRLFKLLRADKVDVIYERYALWQFGGVLAACVCKVPIVLEVNDSALVERVRPLRNKRIAIWFERRIFHNADALITISRCFKRKILDYGLREKKIQVMPNAINPDVIDPFKYEEGVIREEYGLGSSLIIGCVGFFVPWHGLMMILDAFAKLSAHNDSLHLLLVGDGPERNVIENKARDLALSNRVTFTGDVHHHRVPAFIKTFDVAVIPDANEYCSPMKMFEYMGMAKPVVAPSYSPIKEILQHRRNALLFEPKDERGLCQALQTLIDDGQLRCRLGENGRQDVLAKHTWRKNALRVEREFEHIRGKFASQLYRRGVENTP